jgi:hypothetical protein
VLNAVSDEGVPVREIAEAIGRHLNLPARSLPAAEYDGMLMHLLSTDMPASSTITRELLGWKPTHPGLIEDIEQGHYFTSLGTGLSGPCGQPGPGQPPSLIDREQLPSTTRNYDDHVHDSPRT